jgi:PKHD-type hydroxylase
MSIDLLYIIYYLIIKKNKKEIIMELHNYYYYFKSALTPKFCDDVIQYSKEKINNIAVVGEFSVDNRDFNKNPLTKKELRKLREIRDSNVCWFDDRWIYKEVLPYVEEANKAAGWNFQIDSAEHCQFTKYGEGQFYDWHCDSYKFPFDKPNNILDGKIRKLSVTCSLSDPNDYVGGELEFNYNEMKKPRKINRYKCKEILPKGSLVVFPSFVYHRVCPVVKGTRYSLVVWNTGKPFV